MRSKNSTRSRKSSLSSVRTLNPAQPTRAIFDTKLPKAKPRCVASAGPDQYYLWICVVALILAILTVYSNSLTGTFIYDDKVVILQNPTIQRLWPLGLFQEVAQSVSARHTIFGRPITNWSFALNYHLGNFDVFGYHLVNTIIHIISTLAVFGVVRRSFLLPRLRENWGDSALTLSLAIALLWGLHPLHTAAITYITQRLESLAGCLYVLSLYCFIRSDRSGKPALWWVLSAIIMGLGMGSKETVVTAPLVMLLYDRTFMSRSLKEALSKRGWCYCGFLLAWILLGFLISQNHQTSTGINERGGSSTSLSYAATQVGVVLHYLRLTVWPNPLILDYFWPQARTLFSILGPGVIIFPLICLSVWGTIQNKTWGFIGAWFFIILAPSSSFVPISDEYVNEYRMYLPSLAPVTLIVLGGYLISRRVTSHLAKTDGSDLKKQRLVLFLILVCLIAVLFGVRTYERNKTFVTPIALWSDNVRRAPNNPRAYLALGIALGEVNQIPQSSAYFKKALDIYQDYYEAYINIGLNYLKISDFENAVQVNKRALNLRPTARLPRINLGIAYSGLKNYEAASIEFNILRISDPEDKEVRYALFRVLRNWAADLYNQAGDFPAATDRLRQALELYPDDPQVKQDLSKILVRWGAQLIEAKDPEEGVRKFKDSLKINPSDITINTNLAIALNHWAIDLYKKGDKQGAIKVLEEAHSIDSLNRDVIRNLSLILR